MTKEARNPNGESSADPLRVSRSGFVIRHSFGFRHSSFVIGLRALARLIPVVLFIGACGLLAAASAGTPGAIVSLEFQLPSPGGNESRPALHLRGKTARRQLLVTAELDDGALRDFTRQVSYSVSPPRIVSIDKTGRVTPLAEGAAIITAKGPDGQSATLSVAVEYFNEVAPINFPNQIVPVFTKAGCNAGGCHGKSSGQNGFRLSLLGFEPMEDYEHLVKEARGRRLFPASPENSLLLLKATATLPHGGGRRMDKDSDDYRLLVRWISEGLPYGKPTDPKVDRIEVFPRERTMALGGEQQLVVMARYTDGSTEDVTRSALYEPNDKEMARTDEAGHLQLFSQPGDVAVMVRYQARVAVFRATVPLGAPVANLPPPRNLIDKLVFKKLTAVGMPPSEVCDDATFIRRVTIDIAGRLPTLDEARRFFAECGDAVAESANLSPHPQREPAPDPSQEGNGRTTSSQQFPSSGGDRGGSVVGAPVGSASSRSQAAREALIDRLLDSADYADYFANKWSALLRNKRTEAKQARSTYAFHAWIRDSLLENKPYDRFVREILTASGDMEDNPAVAWYHRVREPQAELEDTAQLFLGMRLQCAQCHHHPFEKWSQQDYYSFSAFFTQVSHKNGTEPDGEMVFARRAMPTATNKKTKQSVKPAGLGSGALNLSPDDDARQALADWMTGRNNPYFARSLVNRYWKHFFNRGIVEPEDDMRETNPPTNPELLDGLAGHFIAHGYDLKNLVRTICRSQVYQLSGIPNQHNRIDKQYFSRYYPKRLTAEVLFDAVNQVTKTPSKFDGLPAGTRAVCLPDNSFNASSYFLTVFGRPDSSSACECERSQDASLAQSLHLLNAKEIQQKLADDQGVAARLTADTKRSDEEKIRELYLTAYAREPDASEATLARDYLAKRTANKDDKESLTGRRQAYEDIVWALINTKEFLFNH
ncbi:MAG TPA: DUF1553 domain-containing protein [Haliangiales bacterium]|nr:DUF1553 domain-containing protein [Haliangiales bacterium]